MDSCLIIAGEKSGEEHAQSFFKELKALCPNHTFFGVGGDYLESMGVELLYHLKDFSSMGFSEVVQKIPFYFKALNQIEREVIKREAKTAILIDFQDFNLRLAQKLSKRGVKVLYYVAPQAWAWKPYRARALADSVHTLFTILPFEKKWFLERGVHQIKSVPHPLSLTYKDQFKSIPLRPYGVWKEKLKILLLPGSRRYEVYSLLPEFIKAIKELKKTLPVEVHLVKVDHINTAIYEYYKNDVDVWYSSDELVTAMKECHFSFAASGTVTLSTGLFELPTVVCYKASLLNEFIFYNFIKYNGPISLTNIIHDKMVFPELTQNRVRSDELVRIIYSWIQSETVYNNLKRTLEKTRDLISGEDFSVPKYMAQVLNE